MVEDQVAPIHPEIKENVFCVWYNDNPEKHEKAIKKMIKSQDLRSGNMIRANL